MLLFYKYVVLYMYIGEIVLCLVFFLIILSVFWVYRCLVYIELLFFCILDIVFGDCCKKLNCFYVVFVGIIIIFKFIKLFCEWCKDILFICEFYG